MKTQDLLDTLSPQIERPDFTPTRTAGLARLDQFASRTGQHYAKLRNYDLGADQRSNVSALSPWIRHRLITEEEVLRHTLARHSAQRAEKFIDEVFWRTYFKGWLEQRPDVWPAYQAGVRDALGVLEKDGALAARYDQAITGQTGIDCLDHWVRELVETGYLHNHARMWFASIWIFTLKLPWELGADFFLRHLMDGDPASNTLSWRWVGGLHTKGRTYLARVSNISKFTDGQFCPEYQLSPTAEPLEEDAVYPRMPVPEAYSNLTNPLPPEDYLLLITEEDCQIAEMLPHAPTAVMGLLATQGRSPLDIGQVADAFARSALSDACVRAGGAEPQQPDAGWAAPLIAAAKAQNLSLIVTPYAPVGPVATAIDAAEPELNAAGLKLVRLRREYDDLAWPHATKGFFAMRKKIPSVLRDLGLAG